MMGGRRWLSTLEEAARRDGWLRLADRAWQASLVELSTRVPSRCLGRLRNLWRVPALRRRHRGGCLNCGCGHDRRSGWLNADLGLAGDIHLDVTRHFPFPDEYFSLIFSEHLLEHLTEAGARSFLRECHRVLQPGGIMRLSTPNLEHEVRAYLKPPAETLADRQRLAPAAFFGVGLHIWKYPPGTYPTPAQALNDALRLWEHCHLYDETDLREALQEAGFGDVRRYVPGEGSTPQTTGLETRLESSSLVLEARR
jgi:predicted SAM-dependent methyltransferase